eukprot:gene5497-10287_t
MPGCTIARLNRHVEKHCVVSTIPLTCEVGGYEHTFHFNFFHPLEINRLAILIAYTRLRFDFDAEAGYGPIVSGRAHKRAQ